MVFQWGIGCCCSIAVPANSIRPKSEFCKHEDVWFDTMQQPAAAKVRREFIHKSDAKLRGVSSRWALWRFLKQWRALQLPHELGWKYLDEDHRSVISGTDVEHHAASSQQTDAWKGPSGPILSLPIHLCTTILESKKFISSITMICITWMPARRSFIPLFQASPMMSIMWRGSFSRHQSITMTWFIEMAWACRIIKKCHSSNVGAAEKNNCPAHSSFRPYGTSVTCWLF